MHTKISPENPYGCNRYGFAWQRVPAGGQAHLDFGCGDGGFLNSLTSKGIRRLVGVDASAEAVDRARHGFPLLEVIHIRQTVPLPFEQDSFNSATLLDVLEHVDKQRALLEEISRVLKPNAVLIVTVPRQHVFSFLDAGNLKFRFPAVHRWYYSRRHSPEEYRRRYVDNPDGLIGDISARKRWHEHFAPAKLARLLAASGFSVTEFDGTGLLLRPLGILDHFFKRFPRAYRILRHVAELDSKQHESTNLFCLARNGAEG